MKPIPGKLYKVSWIDAAGESAWSDEKRLEELIEKYEKPVEQVLIFVKESKKLFVFTSGRHTGDEDYVDFSFIPKPWVTMKPLTKKDL